MIGIIALLASVNMDEPKKLDPLQVTAGRVETSVSEVSSAVHVVDEVALEQSDVQIVVDALRGVPGVFVQQTTPGQGIPIVRGLKGSEVLHLVDGFRLNNAFFRNAPNQYIALVDPNSLARVEVVRGAASTLYGADALGGVVNFLSRDPMTAGAGGELVAYGQSADEALGISLRQDFSGKQLGGWIQGSYLETGDRETANGTVGPSGYEARAINGAIGSAGDLPGRWRLHWQFSEQPSTPRVDELVAGFGQTEAESDEFYFEPNQRGFVLFSYDQTVQSRLADKVSAKLGWQRLQDDRRSRATGSVNRRLEENRSDLYGVTLQATKSAADHQWVYGIEHYYDEVDSARSELNLESNVREAQDPRFPDGSDQTSTAAFVQREWFLPAGSLTTGLRYSDLSVDINGVDAASSANLNFSELTAQIGWHQPISTSASLVANLSEGFRAPNIFDLATLGPRPGNRFNVANANLEPEHLLSIDVGLKWSSANTQAEAFVFHSDFDDKITSVATGEIFEGRTVVRSENVSSVSLYGIELGVRHALSDAWQIGSALNWVRGTERGDDGGDQPADRVPPLNGQVEVVYDSGSAWTVTSRVRFAAKQDRLSARDVRDPRINPDGTPGWATLDLIWGYDAQAWRAQAGLYNALDKSYREHGSGIDAPGRSIGLQVGLEWQ